MADTKATFRAGMFTALKRAPYMSGMLYGLPIVHTDAVETMAVTDQGVMYVNDQFVDALGAQQHGAQKLGTVIFHELLHLLMDHPKRGKRLALTEETAPTWQMAVDFAVNGTIQHANNTATGVKWIWPEAEFAPLLAEAHKLPPNLSAEGYFEELLKRKKKGGQQPKQGKAPGQGNCGSCAGGKPSDGEPQDQPQGQGEGAGKSDKDTPRPNRVPTPAQLDQMRRNTQAALREHAEKNRGTDPLGILRELDELLAPPKVPWDEKFAALVGHAKEHCKGAFEHTYLKPNRRQAGLALYAESDPDCPGVPLLAGWRENMHKVVFALDTSGSMGNAEFNELLAEAAAILECGGSQITFLACDAKVHTVAEVSSVQEMIANIRGGGGTDMAPVFLAINQREEQPDLVVVATDGYIGHPGPEPDYPVIWLISKGGATSCGCEKFGDIVQLD